MPNAEQVYLGAWNNYGRTFTVACCDCGLCHKITLRRRHGRYQIRFEEDRIGTAAIRREMRKKTRREKDKKRAAADDPGDHAVHL